MQKMKTKLKTVLAVSTGKSHRSSNLPCQDSANRFRKSDTECGIVLSDGAGSAQLSHIGSSIVVDRILEYVSCNFDKMYKSEIPDPDGILKEINSYLSIACDKYSVKKTAFAATALFVYAKVVEREVCYVVGNLGDGLVLRCLQGVSTLELGPENAEHANQTWFVTDSDAADHFRLKTGRLPLEETPGWVLATDGPSPFLFSSRKNQVAPAAGRLLEELRLWPMPKVKKSAEKFLEALIVPRTGDDCSIGLLQCAPRIKSVKRRMQLKSA